MHISEVTLLAQRAWDSTKDPSDPVWNECDTAHRQKFLAIAQAVVDSGHAVDGFEHAVKRLANEAQSKREVIEQVQVEHPTAHSDELQLMASRRSAEGLSGGSIQIEKGTKLDVGAGVPVRTASASAISVTESSPQVEKEAKGASKKASKASSSKKAAAKSPRKDSKKDSVKPKKGK